MKRYWKKLLCWWFGHKFVGMHPYIFSICENCGIHTDDYDLIIKAGYQWHVIGSINRIKWHGYYRWLKCNECGSRNDKCDCIPF